MQWVYLKGRKRAVYKFLRGGLVLALGWARPGGWGGPLDFVVLAHRKLVLFRTTGLRQDTPMGAVMGSERPPRAAGPEPLDFIVLALGCSKNRYTRPAQGGGAGLLIYSQNRWPRTPITYKKKILQV